VQAKPSTFDLNVDCVIKRYIQTFPFFLYLSPKNFSKTKEFFVNKTVSKFALAAFFALPVFAQNSPPQWVEESWRTAHYPSAEWYTGFARDNIKSQPNSKTYQSIEKEAQNKLSESIQVKIQSSTAIQTTSRQNNSSETISMNYKQAITTASNAAVAKMETHSHFDKETGYIYGFAAVRKKELAEFYTAKINGLFSFAESELSIANQLAEIGKKKSALNKIKATEDSLSRIDYWRNLLQAVTGATTDNRSAEIMQKINTAKIALENSIIIYLKVSGNEYVAEELPAVLQEKGCNCTVSETAGEADYAITVNAKFSRCNKAELDEVYCYAIANVSVENAKTKKPVSLKIPEGKGGWTGGDKNRAMAKSFEDLTVNITEKILKEIEK